MEDLMGKGMNHAGDARPSSTDGMLRRDQLREYVEGAVTDTLGGQLASMKSRLTTIATRLESNGDTREGTHQHHIALTPAASITTLHSNQRRTTIILHSHMQQTITTLQLHHQYNITTLHLH
jgi:hypothetical protein